MLPPLHGLSPEARGGRFTYIFPLLCVKVPRAELAHLSLKLVGNAAVHRELRGGGVRLRMRQLRGAPCAHAETTLRLPDDEDWLPTCTTVPL